ncbi:beta-galactosidase GalA [Planctomycetota bacterium]
MKSKTTFTFRVIVCAFAVGTAMYGLEARAKFAIPKSPRQRLSMDFGWRFNLGHTSDIKLDFGYGGSRTFAKTGSSYNSDTALGINFDDSGWRKVDLPHDWAVELDFSPEADRSHGFKMVGRKFPSNSIGWYRKTFELPKSDEGKRLSLEFDGVFRDSIAFLNGHLIGRNLGGYNSFRYDITDFAHYGDKNLLVVRVDASLFEGWFYEGAGIYRHVWLTKTNPLHVAGWGTFVSSTVQEGLQSVLADVTVQTKIANEQDKDTNCRIISTILNAKGDIVAEAECEDVCIDASADREITQQVTVEKPNLWSVDSPYLYRLVTTIKQDGKVVDTYETDFGIRTVRFDADEGFFLNGESMKIKGVCIHHDHASVGSALPDSIQEFRIKKLKEMGVNAYRCSHNHPTPELLDACDRLGMLVLDEHRMMGSSEEILSQLESLILRDRNHPSVFMWCVGNEEMNIQATDVGARIMTTMKRVVNRLDPTRLVTVADNNVNDSWGSEFSLVGDVLGCNYFKLGDADGFHEKFPNHPIIGSENASTQCTRGIYENDEEKGFTNAYGTTLPEWGRTPVDTWSYVAVRPYLAGVFLWTGIDYRGEPSPYSWPCINSHYGIMDTCCFPKDSYYYYQAWWTDQTVLHIFPHWNWAGKEGEQIDVWCYSNCNEVELFLNGKSQGRKTMQPYSRLEWNVKYEPGTLEAKGYKNGELVATKKVQTASAPAQIKLEPDRQYIKADSEDTVVVAVAITDALGRIVPTADNEITFSVSENAKIIGVGNGNPSSHEPDKANKRKAFNSLCMVIIQSTREPGTIELTAESPDLRSSTLVFRAEECETKPFVPSLTE